MSQSLDIDTANVVLSEWNLRTIERYRQDIRKYLGYRVFTAQDNLRIVDYLIVQLKSRYLTESVLIEQARLYFVKNKIEIVNTKQLETYVASAIQKFDQQFIDKIFDSLTQEQLILIDIVLNTDSDADDEYIELSELKKDISGVQIKNGSYAK